MPHGKDFIRVKLSPDSEEFKEVERRFRETMPKDKATLVKIERVQNPYMWEKLNMWVLVLKVYFMFSRLILLSEINKWSRLE